MAGARIIGWVAELFEKAVFKDAEKDVADDVTKNGAKGLERGGVFRGPSQKAPGGQIGSPVSIKQLKMELGRAGMSVNDYDVVHSAEITLDDGSKAYGRSVFTGDGLPELGPSGKPKIEISNLGLSSTNEAVTTTFHEMYHHMSMARTGIAGSERQAEAYGLKMLKIFLSRTGRA